MKFLVFHARHHLNEGGFDLVAEVEAEELRDVFGLTLHRNGSSWTQNPGVTALVDSPRSSMVNDIIVTEELEVYNVDWYLQSDITNLVKGRVHLLAARQHWNLE